MKIITTIVSNEGYGAKDGNEDRFENLKIIMNKESLDDFDVLVLPAGYFYANLDEEINEVLEMIKDMVTDDTIIIGGIDQTPKDYKHTRKKIEGYSLPYYVFVVGKDVKHKWRQRSANSKDQKYVPNHALEEDRSIVIRNENSGFKIEPIACGELFNKRIKNSIVEKKVDVAINLIHSSAGFRCHSSMGYLSSNGVRVMSSAHSNTHRSMKWHHDNKGNDLKTRDYDLLIDGPPRTEVKIWDIWQ